MPYENSEDPDEPVFKGSPCKQRIHNRRKPNLGFFETLHMTTIQLTGLQTHPAIGLSKTRFCKLIRMSSMVQKKIKIKSTLVRYGETFYGHHTALNTRCIEVKGNL